MNKQEMDILNELYINHFLSQREIAGLSGHSLGIVNRSMKQLAEDGYLSETGELTRLAHEVLKENKPQRAVILAAGFGMRMVPINMEIPKGLIEIHGEALIERQIKQLHEVGITEIYVVVGFLKEKFEYLIDEYNITLIVNPEYAKKNNLYSMKLVAGHLSNAYIIPCDIWCHQNPFSRTELYSWYMVGNWMDADSSVRVNRKAQLVCVEETEKGNAMIGIAYLTGKEAETVKMRILQLCEDHNNDHKFWESALYQKERMIVYPKVVQLGKAVELNTYEQLRELDDRSEQLKSETLHIITQALQVRNEDITDITILKKGMTNRSFLFRCKGKRYIMRIPGEGTDRLINRAEEAEIYHVINGRGICDDIAYMDPQNGYKITEYLENARVCDPFEQSDVEKCMSKLKAFHQTGLQVKHEFDIFRQIQFYESLWNGQESIYKDYRETKKKVFSLQEYIEQHVGTKVLTHIDAVPDNFLFINRENGKEEVRLIDWEYAGMQDPHVDLAMFCIYSLYDREWVERLIDIYFEKQCPREIRIKIYAYIAACGLLWSNWCEYKRQLGVEFGEYSLRQYRYAKEYYRIVQEELSKEDRR